MKLLSVSLGLRRGDIEVFGKVDVPNKNVTFQLLVSGVLIGESYDYDELREVAFEIVAMNQTNKEGMI